MFIVLTNCSWSGADVGPAPIHLACDMRPQTRKDPAVVIGTIEEHTFRFSVCPGER